MPRNFARHEQFLRIFALLELLTNAHQPLDDETLVNALKEKLGLMRLSPRTLRRDCEFLSSCGYSVDHVQGIDPGRYAARPRLISALSAAITDCQEVEVEQGGHDDQVATKRRLQPMRLVIRPPDVSLLAFPVDPQDDQRPTLIKIETIRKVTPLDVTFVPRPVDLESLGHDG